MGDLDRLPAVRRDGSEPFRAGGADIGAILLDFWQWSVSDLVSNATRGRLAEYIVAKGIGVSTAGVRDEWAACDLCTSAGVQVEVKSAAYLQSWHQKDYSTIQFSVRKAREWSSETNVVGTEPVRTAHVYVFALLFHKSKATLDPLNLDQWQFFVLPTRTLDERERSQSSITLASLEGLVQAIPFAGLRHAVEAASLVARGAT
ncbi:MAG TPA: hypothetical protein VGM20_03230 [Gemmatimonadales bacterium]